MFVFNRFKTDYKYKEQTFEFKKEANGTVLARVLKAYIKDEGLEPGMFLFGKKLIDEKDSGLSGKIAKTFQRYVGYSTNVNLLRHSIISDFYSQNPNDNQKEELAMKMGHTVSTQSNYNRVDTHNALSEKAKKKKKPTKK